MPITPGGSNDLKVDIDGDSSGLLAAVTAAQTGMRSFRKSVGALSVALGALAAGGIAKSIQAASKFEDAMVEVEKVTSPEVAAELSDEMLRLSETIPLTSQELANIAAQAGRFGVEGSENIAKFTESVAKMAFATDLTVDEVGTAFAKLSTILGIPIDQMENMGSAINTLANNFATSSSEIVEGMMRNAAALKAMGMRSEDIMGLTAAMNEVTPSARRAGTQVRRLAVDIMNASEKDIMTWANALGMTVEEFKRMRKNDPNALIMKMAKVMDEGGEGADALRKSMNLVSGQALQSLGSNLESATRAQQLANDSFREGTSMQAEFEAQMNTLTAQSDLLRNKLTNIGIKIGTALLPALTQAVKWLSSATDSVSNFVDRIGPMNAAIGAVATTIGLLVFGISQLAAGFATIPFAGTLAGFTSLSGAAGGLVGILGAVASGLLTIVAPAALVAAAIYALATDFAGVRTEASKTFSVLVSELRSIVGPIQQLLGFIGQAFSTVFASTEGDARGFVQSIGATLRNGLQSIGDFVRHQLLLWTVWWQMHGEEVARKVKAGVTQLFGIFQQAFTRISAIVQQALVLIRTNVAQNMGQVRSITSNTLSVWKSIIVTALTAVTQLWNVHGQKWLNTIESNVMFIVKLFMQMRTMTLAVMEPFVARLKQFWKKHGEDIALIVSTLVGVVLALFRGLVNLVRGILEPFLTAMQLAWKHFGDEIVTIVTIAFDAIFSVIGAVIDTIATLIRAFHAAQEGDWNQFSKILMGLVERLWDGILNFIEKSAKKIAKLIDGFIGDVIAFFKDLSRELIGGSIIPDMFRAIINAYVAFVSNWLGLWQGLIRDVINFVTQFAADVVRFIQQMLDDVIRAVQRWSLPTDIYVVVSSALTKVTNFTSSFLSAGKSLIQAVIDGVKNKAGALYSAVKSAVQDAKDLLPGSDAEEGPLSTLTKSGEALPETFAKGMLKQEHSVEHAALRLAESARISDALSQPSTVPQRAPGTPLAGELHIHANSREEGRAAFRGLAREARSHGLDRF